MKFLIDLISEQLSGAFEKAGFDAAYGRATLSNRPDLCEYQCNGALANISFSPSASSTAFAIWIGALWYFFAAASAPLH